MVAVASLSACLSLSSCRNHDALPPAAKLTFNRDIEPILSQNCYQCHGPDPGSRKASLRLDRPEFAFAPHEKMGPAIVAGDPLHSPLVQRILSADPKQVMPPAEAHKTLTARQIATLRRWVQEGATYEEHWSFVPPQRPAVPAVQQTAWPRTPIDRFILARLEHEGLAPAPEADRATLIRRVSYDLTGLPPTPEEADAFARDPSPTAYEKVVDRLLASPRYGEHRAHYWLDVARYGDTHGIHFDNYRMIWPYRDYVISSYNANKPFDQFTLEQLAGDLLPPTNVDQLVATAFIRAGISTGEGGTILEENRFNLERERTEMFGAAYLGMTTGCAVCHDHKFDPITQKDFYRLAAFFNNLDEIANTFDRGDWPPFLRVPRLEKRAAYDAVLAQRAELERQLGERRRHARELIAAWIARSPAALRPVSPAGWSVRLRCDEQTGSTLTNSAPDARWSRVTAAGSAPIWGEQTWLWPTFRMETGTKIEMLAAGDFEKNQPWSAGAWLLPRLDTVGGDPLPTFSAILARADSTQGSRGWGLYFDNGKVMFRLVHHWPDDALAVETVERPLAPGLARVTPVVAGTKQKVVLDRYHWNHVFATYDGSGRAAGVRLYVNGVAQAVTVVHDALAGSVRNAVPLELSRESPDASPLREATYQDVRLYERELSAGEAGRIAYADPAAEIVRRPMAQWTEDEFKTVSDYYFREQDPATRALAAQLPALDARLGALAQDGDVCLVSRESPRLAYADVQVRGVYSQRAERVRPGTPHFLPQLPAGVPQDRLSLARWLVSPGNPLTARVAVNRMWQEVFGLGLVETTEDFGLVGERPSHPELLDWLAVDFREHGWDMKRFYRQLVLSATYRQSARTTPALLEKDPKNRLLAHGPRFRVDAEMLRDSALAESGLLVEKLGGPSVKPYQPPGVWESGFRSGNTASYVMDHGASLYRRSLYTFWKRMAPMPNMDTFDAAPRDNSCTRRQRTSTPLQALVTMNDPQWLEASRRLAERVLLHDPTLDTRLDYLGRIVLARPWLPGEKAVLERAYAQFHATYAADTQAAAQLIAVGESRPNPALAPTELAPWMLVASTAINLNAALNK